MPSAVLSLAEIPTLTLLYKLGKLLPPTSPSSGASAAYNTHLSLVRTDITTLLTDCIVNAANRSLLGGGGVDGAIHRAAGPALLDECESLQGCATGDAKVTNAYRLPCKKIIHAVGPVYATSKRPAELLTSCYTRSLDRMLQSGCRSIAFSCLSTGAYGYPSDEAAALALGAVKGWLDADAERAAEVERVVFCCFLEKDERAYVEAIPKFFPPDEEFGEERKVGAEANPLMPKLPDVPTTEPKEDGQPDAKKLRYYGGSTGRES